MPGDIAIPVPDSIRRIVDSADRSLAWHFFVFFARFEYALKRDPRYLNIKPDPKHPKAGDGNVEPNWDKFAADHNQVFVPESSPALKAAVDYFLAEPPRKQIGKDSTLNWSEPQHHDGREPLLIWLLRMVRCVRNNLFHGGKFPPIPIADPSRDRELLLKAMTILNTCLSLDDTIEDCFADGLDE